VSGVEKSGSRLIMARFGDDGEMRRPICYEKSVKEWLGMKHAFPENDPW